MISGVSQTRSQSLEGEIPEPGGRGQAAVVTSPRPPAVCSSSPIAGLQWSLELCARASEEPERLAWHRTGLIRGSREGWGPGEGTDQAALSLSPAGTLSRPHRLSAIGTLGSTLGKGPRPSLCPRSAERVPVTASGTALLPWVLQEAMGSLEGAGP